MKPLPTLTKPLRSRRPRDQGAGRRRCASAPTRARFRPAASWARRWSRSCWPPPTARSSAATTSTTSRAALRAYEERIGWSRGCGETAALVLVGFMGAGKSTGARALAAELGVQALDSDRELEQRGWASRSRSFFDREGEAAFRAREEEVVLRAARRAATPRWSRSAAARCSPSACARRCAATRSCSWRSTRRTPGGARPGRAARWRAIRAASSSSSATAEPLYEAVADAVLPAGGPRRAAAGAAVRCAALGAAPPGTRLVWAGAESGDYPVFFGRGLIEAGFFPPLDGPPLRGHRRERGPAASASSGDERIVVMAGEEHKTIARRRARAALAGAGAAPSAATWSWRSAAGWSATWPASAPRSTSAACATSRCPPRWWPRSTPPTAGRPAWTCRRARTTSAPTTSRRPCCATPPRSTRCPPRRWPPATRRWSRPR